MSHQHRQIVWQVPMKVPRPFLFFKRHSFTIFHSKASSPFPNKHHCICIPSSSILHPVQLLPVACTRNPWPHHVFFNRPEVLRSSGNYTKDSVPLTPGQDEAPLPSSSVSYLPAESSSSWNLHPLLPPEPPQPPSSFNSVTLIIQLRNSHHSYSRSSRQCPTGTPCPTARARGPATVLHPRKTW